jgi:hypothetical protein
LGKIFGQFSARGRCCVSEVVVETAVNVFKINEQLSDVVLAAGCARDCPFEKVKLVAGAVTETMTGRELCPFTSGVVFRKQVVGHCCKAPIRCQRQCCIRGILMFSIVRVDSDVLG